MAKFLFIVFVVKCVAGGLFDLMDIDDTLEFMHNKQTELLNPTECKAKTQSSIKDGVCTSLSKCLLSGGSPNGFCGILSTCCVSEKGCGKTTNSKVTYFEGSDLSSNVKSCSYVIKLQNPNVCQIRLDFVKFNLAPATLTQIQSSTNAVYKCNNDRLTISPNYYGIPDLCGNNDKQHIYIHVNQSGGVTRGVQLDMTLADRTAYPTLGSPSWKIKVTQLECPGYKTGFKLPSEDAIKDFKLLAPVGAIQYFTEEIGYIKSFGFDGSVIKQSYSYDQKYTMAFKRDIDICGVKFVPEYIYLPKDNIEPYVDSNCKHYLFVPELNFDVILTTTHTLVSKVCLTSAEVFRSYAPGPLYVHFNSMATNFVTDETRQQGFNIRYELLNKCS